MTFRFLSAAMLTAVAVFAGSPELTECFKVNELLKTDAEHYWANWSNACPYTIDSVYVAVRFSDRSGVNLGEGVWALHFLPPGAHRVTRFTTPQSVADFDSVRVRKITSNSEEALLSPNRVGDPGPAVAVTARIESRPVVIAAVPERGRTTQRETAAPPKVVEVAHSASAEEHHRRGRQFLRNRNYPAAIAELTEAIRQEPESSSAFNARGFALYMSHQYRPALEDLDQAIRLKPNYLNAYQIRKQARRAAGDVSGSEADAKTIRELSHAR